MISTTISDKEQSTEVPHITVRHAAAVASKDDDDDEDDDDAADADADDDDADDDDGDDDDIDGDFCSCVSPSTTSNKYGGPSGHCQSCWTSERHSPWPPPPPPLRATSRRCRAPSRPLTTTW